MAIGNTTIFLGLGTAASTTVASSVNDDGTIDKKQRDAYLTTTVATSASTTAANITNKHSRERLHEKYSSEYVESLSDDELAKMLQELNLLETEKFQDNCKTI